jgi:uncharacterized protein with GYD domain
VQEAIVYARNLKVNCELTIALGGHIGPSASTASASSRGRCRVASIDAVKNLTDNPQDRTAAVSKTAEQFGGKLESLLLFPNSGEFDGLAIMQMPSDTAMEEVNLVIRSSGSFTRLQVTPVLTPAEFKSMLEAAKQGAPSYAAPGK